MTSGGSFLNIDLVPFSVFQFIFQVKMIYIYILSSVAFPKQVKTIIIDNNQKIGLSTQGGTVDQSLRNRTWVEAFSI